MEKKFRIIIIALSVIAVSLFGLIAFNAIYENNEITRLRGDYIEVTKKVKIEEVVVKSDTTEVRDSALYEAIYRWDDGMNDWVVLDDTWGFQSSSTNYSYGDYPLSAPIEIEWDELMDILYRLQYSDELDADFYYPIFGQNIDALHGMEIIIEGFVIPIDEEGELLALSYNPFASCFFCGKAGPASVMSVYLRDEEKSYRTDDFRKFKGTLYLNHLDPDEFYYILRNAEEA